MSDISLPSPREPAVQQSNGMLVVATNWYRYFNALNPTSLQATVTAQAATIVTLQAQVATLNKAVSTIRDVALFNSLTSASEIPDLGR